MGFLFLLPPALAACFPVAVELTLGMGRGGGSRAGLGHLHMLGFHAGVEEGRKEGGYSAPSWHAGMVCRCTRLGDLDMCWLLRLA